ncbi:MAG: GIY-YIG nuclease family protein [Cyanobacteria bacterium J06621_8]
MSTQVQINPLANLEFIPYITQSGDLDQEFQGQIGVYAIFNQKQEMQYVGYSRDVYSSLRQHLIRQPENCYWVKVQTIARPSRSVLEEISSSWMQENGSTPPGNGAQKPLWTEPIDANLAMTEAEKAQYQQSDEGNQRKMRKAVARRVQGEIKSQLSDRGIKMSLRFNPKLKEKGLLDLQ